MKLSFSIPSKSSSKLNPIKPSLTKPDDDAKSKHLITEFDPSKPPKDPNSQTFIIPPLENTSTGRPFTKMKNLHLPITDPNASTESLGFELDTSSAAAERGSGLSYGLNLFHHDDSEKEKPDDDGGGGGGDGDYYRHRVPAKKARLQKLKDDLKSLPDDEGFDAFKNVPVEGFSTALLAGYGWSEGMEATEKNAKEDVKVVRYQRRAGREGLGFVGDDRASIWSKNKKKDKEEEGEGGTKESGKIVRIVGGRDTGSKASVVRSIGDDWLVLKLSRNGEQVKVKMDDVAESGSIEEESCLKKLKIQHGDKDKGLKNKRDRDDARRGHGEVKVQEKKRAGVNGDRRKEEQDIRVRVISRDFKGGRLYSKKGEVLDVGEPTTCDIFMDESKEIIQGVSQDLLETAIPRYEGLVLVLYGKHKGAYGSLIERDLGRKIGIVRDADTHELLQVKLEQIAEYIGDPSFLGH